MSRPPSHPFATAPAPLLVLLAALIPLSWATAPAAAGSGRAVFGAPEVVVSGDATVSDRDPPGVAPVADGAFAAVWSGTLGDGEAGILHRIVGADGEPTGPIRLTRGRRPTSGGWIAPRGAGGFALFYWSRADDLGNQLLRMVRYHGDGSFSSGPIPVSEPLPEVVPTAVAGDPLSGRVLVAYAMPTTSDPSGPARILARLFSSAGVAESESVAVSGEADRILGLDAALGRDGSFAVVWTEDPPDGALRTMLRAVSADGTPAGAATAVSHLEGGASYGAAVAARPGGGFRVVYATFGDPRNRIWLRTFGPRGDADPPRALGDAAARAAVTPELDVAVSAADATLAVWTARPPGGEGLDVLAQAFTEAGPVADAPFRLHLDPRGEQRLPAVTGVSPFGFALGWLSRARHDGPVELRARLVRVEAGPPGGAPEEPERLEPFQIGCDEARLRGLLARLWIEADSAAEPGSPVNGVVVGPTRSGDFAGVAYRTGAGGEESLLAFAANPEETSLLRNPERLPLPSVSLARIPSASDLVTGGSGAAYRLLLDPTLAVGDPDPAALLAIDNVSGAAGVSADAKPGRGLLLLLDPCHDRFVEADAQVFQLLRRLVRGEARGAASFEAAVYRAEAPGRFRIDLYPHAADGRSLGRLAAELDIERTPDGRIWTGLLRLRGRCASGVSVGCTSVTAPTALELVAPTFGAPAGPVPTVRIEASGGQDPPEEVRFAWSDLLDGTTWLERSP